MILEPFSSTIKLCINLDYIGASYYATTTTISIGTTTTKLQQQQVIICIIRNSDGVIAAQRSFAAFVAYFVANMQIDNLLLLVSHD